MDNRYACSYSKSNGETRVLYSETSPSHEGVSDMSYSVVSYAEPKETQPLLLLCEELRKRKSAQG